MSNFLSALKQVAPVVSFEAKPVPVPQQAPEVTPEPVIPTFDVTIDRVIDRNRLDVKFSVKPDARTLRNMHDAGFQWSAQRSSWYHKDTPENQAFLCHSFGARFPQVESYPAEIPVTSTTETIEQKPEIDQPVESPDFVTYKKQVDALLQSTGMTAADLMVYAIDYLYRNTIAN